ncbi:hypothetical protein BN1326_60164 [Staphylococcus argenteus]|uniref:Uncharacterized protein n=1 Tax=Staphylococcus argenteus TaxID=985002 RepID=A0A7U7JTS2_9STAP|nr:hypothetical protein BN1326_60164 [Staphylococcus argenteus]CRI25775.1 hypothetical protein BN1326_60164 [Staphylococcus argenteus]
MLNYAQTIKGITFAYFKSIFYLKRTLVISIRITLLSYTTKLKYQR